MNKIDLNTKFIDFIEKIILQQINGKIYYQNYITVNNENSNIFDLSEFKSEINTLRRSNPDKKELIKDLQALFKKIATNVLLIEKMIQLFTDLKKTSDVNISDNPFVYTYSDNDFIILLPPVNFFNNGYKYSESHSLKELFDYCINTAGIIKSFIDEMKPPISELTLQSICNENELKGICKILIDEKFISKINEVDFLHHFTGQPMDKNINKIEFLPEFKGNANHKRLYDTIVHLINKETLQKEDFNKIAYSFKDKKGNIIQLNYKDKQYTKNFNREFLDFLRQSKKRLKP
jgi:hypothetical protein